jgi:hypothetical protein
LINNQLRPSGAHKLCEVINLPGSVFVPGGVEPTPVACALHGFDGTTLAIATKE